MFKIVDAKMFKNVAMFKKKIVDAKMFKNIAMYKNVQTCSKKVTMFKFCYVQILIEIEIILCILK